MGSRSDASISKVTLPMVIVAFESRPPGGAGLGQLGSSIGFSNFGPFFFLAGVAIKSYGDQFHPQNAGSKYLEALEGKRRGPWGDGGPTGGSKGASPCPDQDTQRRSNRPPTAAGPFRRLQRRRSVVRDEDPPWEKGARRAAGALGALGSEEETEKKKRKIRFVLFVFRFTTRSNGGRGGGIKNDLNPSTCFLNGP